MELPSSNKRVSLHSSQLANRMIEDQADRAIERYGGASKVEIDARIRELDREWDIERLLEANAASLTVLGVVSGFTVNKRWFAFPGIVGGFLLQHALQVDRATIEVIAVSYLCSPEKRAVSLGARRERVYNKKYSVCCSCSERPRYVEAFPARQAFSSSAAGLVDVGLLRIRDAPGVRAR